MSTHLREMWRAAAATEPTPASLPDVGPTADDYWGAGGCGALAIAFTHLVPGLKIGVEWGTGHDEGLVWHAAAYDPATGRSFDFNGTDHIDIVLGNFGGTVEMDVDPRRVAESMGLAWREGEPWEDFTVSDAADVIVEHWNLTWGTEAQKTAALSGILTQSPTPLDYRGKFWGPSTRLYITDPDAPAEAPKGDYYFKDNPKGGFKAPTDPHTVAWLDIFEDQTPGKHWVFIAFMAVRSDYRGRGLSSRLIKHLYDTYPDSRIEWGTLVGEVTPGMYQRYKQSHPEQTGQGSTW